MSEFSGLPQWIQTAKREVVQGEEWMEFSKELFDLVNIYMKESGVSSFARLSTNERRILVSRAQDALKKKDLFKQLFARLSASLDEQLSAERSSSGTLGESTTKSEAIADVCNSAVEVILSRWPEMRLHFAQCLNATLSPRLRYIMWHALLQNPGVHQEYTNLAAKSPKKLVSKYDLEIAQKCQLVVESDPTLQPLRDLKAASSVLRHILSYHHVRSQVSSGLSDTEYLVAIPFVFSTLSYLDNSRKSAHSKAISAETLAILVEQFELFWSSRPVYSKFTDSGVGFQLFAEKVLSVLKILDQDFAQRLGDLFANQRFGPVSAAVGAITALLRPCVRGLFVSYLPLGTVLFVYDQMIIGHGVGGYDPLPYLSATLLYLVKEDLKGANSWHEAENSFRTKLRTQNFEALQGIINEKNLLGEIRKPIDAAQALDNDRFCLSAASLSELPPWKHWYSDKLAAHFKPTVSGKTNQASKSKSAIIADFEKTVSQSREDTPLHEVKSERDNLVEEVGLMKRELEEARRRIDEVESAKVEVERYADVEIERLQRKIAYLEKAHILTPPPLLMSSSKLGLTEPEYEESETSSNAGAIPPPPTAEKAEPPSVPIPASPVKAFGPERAGSEVVVPRLDAVVIFNDVIRELMRGANELAHGSGSDREVLDNQTKADLGHISGAYEQAKIDVLGRVVTEEEIEALPEEQRRELASRLSRATRTQLVKMKLGQT